MTRTSQGVLNHIDYKNKIQNSLKKYLYIQNDMENKVRLQTLLRTYESIIESNEEV